MNAINIYICLFLCLGSMVLTTTIDAQTWSLEQCLEHARQSNLRIKAAQMDRTDQIFNRKEANQARFPNLTGSTGFNYSFGRNIDPTTNDFVPQTLGFNNINVSTNILLFNGGRLRKEYAQALLAEQQFDNLTEQTIQDVELDVVLAFLNVLFETERKANAEEQLQLSQQQLDRVQRLVQVDMAPEADTYEWIAQAAANEQQIMASENMILNNIFQLRNLLDIDPEDDFEIELPTLGDDIALLDEEYSISSIYQQVIAQRPEIKAMELGEQVAQQEIEIAKKAYLPSFFLGASLTSNYSTLATTSENFSLQRRAIDGVFINGESVVFEEEVNRAGNSFRTPYFTQLNQNLGFGLGVQLNVPIYDRGVRKITVHRAENALRQTQNFNAQAKRALELQIQQIIADLTNAEKQYISGQRQVEFLRNAYDNINHRFSLGMSNNYDLLDAQNQLNQAINNLTIAKYDLIFRKKILEYFLGNEISL